MRDAFSSCLRRSMGPARREPNTILGGAFSERGFCRSSRGFGGFVVAVSWSEAGMLSSSEKVFSKRWCYKRGFSEEFFLNYQRSIHYVESLACLSRLSCF